MACGLFVPNGCASLEAQVADRIVHGTGTIKLSEPVGIYKLILWSDGFDPLGTKRNRGSAWVLYATVGLPLGPHHNRNTFLVAIGSTNKTHDAVFAKVATDLSSINDASMPLKVYDSLIGHQHAAFIQCYAYLQDTPKKKSHCTGLNSYNSHRGIYFGYNFDLVAVQDRLPSCNSGEI
jgi:hypothetical protein